MEPAEVKVGDIVALQDPVLGRIAHRLVSVESLPIGSYLLVTNGDANHHAEEWQIGMGDKVGAAFLRVRFTGQVVRFLKTIPGMILLLVGAVTLSMALWMARRRRLACSQ